MLTSHQSIRGLCLRFTHSALLLRELHQLDGHVYENRHSHGMEFYVGIPKYKHGVLKYNGGHLMLLVRM